MQRWKPDLTESLFIFGRFRAQTGNEAALEAAITDIAEPTRAEPGCVGFGAYRSRKDARLFYIHSEWVDEAAFDEHARLPHTIRFLEIAQRLIDHPLDVTRADRIL